MDSILIRNQKLVENCLNKYIEEILLLYKNDYFNLKKILQDTGLFLNLEQILLFFIYYTSLDPTNDWYKLDNKEVYNTLLELINSYK